MSEYSEFIDDIMHHYDNSNEAEKREMFEDLLLFWGITYINKKEIKMTTEFNFEEYEKEQEEYRKRIMDFNYQYDSLVKSTPIFSNDHNQDNEEQQPDCCKCSPLEKMEENVSLVAPCNSCGGMKVVGQVHHIPYGPDLRTVWMVYPPD